MHDTADGQHPTGGASVAVEISNRMNRMLGEVAGRGADRARTVITEDLIVTVLHGSLSKGEVQLVQNGQGEAVVALRRSYQNVLREQFSEMVEELTGRRIAAFLSDQSTEPDVAVEAFVLVPAPAAGPTGG